MESLDLKEANELRAKLGLKPLAVDEEVKRGEEPQVNDEQQAVENYRNLQKERAAKLREQELKSRLEKYDYSLLL